MKIQVTGRSHLKVRLFLCLLFCVGSPKSYSQENSKRKHPYFLAIAQHVVIHNQQFHKDNKNIFGGIGKGFAFSAGVKPLSRIPPYIGVELDYTSYWRKSYRDSYNAKSYLISFDGLTINAVVRQPIAKLQSVNLFADAMVGLRNFTITSNQYRPSIWNTPTLKSNSGLNYGAALFGQHKHLFLCAGVNVGERLHYLKKSSIDYSQQGNMLYEESKSPNHFWYLQIGYIVFK